MLANAHLGLWIREEDSTNGAASALMAALLAQWSVIRMHGAYAGPTSEAACSDASLSYAIEATLVTAAVVFLRMHALSGWFVVTARVVCWALIVRECVEDVVG